jgi:hypothetical protein
MTDFEGTVDAAIAAQEVPGCALASTNRDGTSLHIPSLPYTNRREVLFNTARLLAKLP